MLTSHAVGIDLGTTYSCIASLNEHGEPITIPNRDGELATPSVVFFDGHEVIVGTEALRNSILRPDRVIQNAKRFLGQPGHGWTIDGRKYTPGDVATLVLQSLLHDARERLGTVERAVITVPAQFSDIQRQATVQAGQRAGLKEVDIINEPVAASLCFVLGTEGIWFSELTSSQLILVADLGGGTFDLSLVRYEKNSVRVVASGGDLHLGGIDWNQALQKAISRQFAKDFNVDIRDDRPAQQALSMEVEQAKRSLSVRSRAALTCQHAGHRKTYQIDVDHFERLTQPLVDRMEEVIKSLLKQCGLGWAKIDMVLPTGGASRMPMVRRLLKRLSGTTLNGVLSPDQSIAHGAAYYAGMLLANDTLARSILDPKASQRLRQFTQQSVNARALGILVRDMDRQERVPHYLLPASSRLPAAVTQMVGTVAEDQKRARLTIIESGTSVDAEFVALGECVVEPLPAGLPVGSEIEVTIRYDEQARVQVSARLTESGLEASCQIVRPENLIVSPVGQDHLEQREGVHDFAESVEEVTLAGTRRSASSMTVGATDAAAAPATSGPTKVVPSDAAEDSDDEGSTIDPLLRPMLSPRPQRAESPPAVSPKSSGSLPLKTAEVESAEIPLADSPNRPRRQEASTPTGSTKAKLDGSRSGGTVDLDLLDSAELPIPLCNHCGEILDARGLCPVCPPELSPRGRGAKPPGSKLAAGGSKAASSSKSPVSGPPAGGKPARPSPPPVEAKPGSVPPRTGISRSLAQALEDDDFIDLGQPASPPASGTSRASSTRPGAGSGSSSVRPPSRPDRKTPPRDA
jgi:molecular chaperone DnaK